MKTEPIEAGSSANPASSRHLERENHLWQDIIDLSVSSPVDIDSSDSEEPEVPTSSITDDQVSTPTFNLGRGGSVHRFKGHTKNCSKCRSIAVPEEKNILERCGIVIETPTLTHPKAIFGNKGTKGFETQARALESAVKEGSTWYSHPGFCGGWPTRGVPLVCESKWYWSQLCIKHALHRNNLCQPYHQGVEIDNPPEDLSSGNTKGPYLNRQFYEGSGRTDSLKKRKRKNSNDNGQTSLPPTPSSPTSAFPSNPNNAQNIQDSASESSTLQNIPNGQGIPEQTQSMDDSFYRTKYFESNDELKKGRAEKIKLHDKIDQLNDMLRGKEEEIDKLRIKNKELVSMNTKLKEDEMESKKVNESMKVLVNTSQTEKNELRENITNLKKVIEEMKKSKDKIYHDHKKLELDHSKMKREKIELTEKFVHIEVKCSMLQGEIGTLKKENENLKRSENECQMKIKELVNSNMEITKENQDIKASVNSSNSEIQSSLDRMKNEVDEVNRKNKELQEYNLKLINEKERMKKEEFQTLTKIKNLNKYNSELNAEKSKLNTKLEDDRIKYDKLKNEKDDEIVTIKNKAELDIKELKQKLSKLEEENVKLQEEKEKYGRETKAEIENIRKELLDKQKIIEANLNELKDTSKEKEKLNIIIKENQQKIIELEEKCKDTEAKQSFVSTMYADGHQDIARILEDITVQHKQAVEEGKA
ncbi:uncharacterized protein L201_002923 [Kwoniella dendrophila CBS 6074]|uniref:Uncharacterized protein n=1 Tax=Kwoniella dendrophila CBS 6074 TaxID=1295534 RepID=A0AAX4JU00_9TREE